MYLIPLNMHFHRDTKEESLLLDTGIFDNTISGYIHKTPETN